MVERVEVRGAVIYFPPQRIPLMVDSRLHFFLAESLKLSCVTRQLLVPPIMVLRMDLSNTSLSS